MARTQEPTQGTPWFAVLVLAGLFAAGLILLGRFDDEPVGRVFTLAWLAVVLLMLVRVVHRARRPPRTPAETLLASGDANQRLHRLDERVRRRDVERHAPPRDR